MLCYATAYADYPGEDYFLLTLSLWALLLFSVTHYDITMGNYIAMSRYPDIKMHNDIAMSLF